MVDTHSAPSGQTDGGGAATADTVTVSTDGASGGTAEDGTGTGGDTVAYDTHRRLLGEKKKLQEDRDRIKAELERRDAEAAAAEAKRLEDQGEYKKLLDLERKQREELAAKLDGMERNQTEARKLDAVLSAAGGTIPRKFWGLVDISSVALNPDTGEIDAMSVQKTVESIRAEYPEIIRTGNNGGNLPADAAQGGTSGGAITPEQWKNMPLAEQKKRYPEYMESLKARMAGTQ